MTRSLITGGAGFIGSNLADALVSKNHKVIIIDNLSTGRMSNLNNVKKKIKFINIDISQKSKKLEKIFKNIDVVYHLAGMADIVPSIENPEKYFNSNVVGTLNVLSAAKKYKVKKFIYAASASCYGVPEKYPTSEKDNINPLYPYALTKWQAEEIVLHWTKVYRFPAISLRFFNIYGPRSRTSGAYGAVFGVFLAQKLANKPLTIVGDGKQTRDFLYVTDLVEALIAASKSKKIGRNYNVGSGRETSVNRIANLIGGRKVYIPKRPGEPDRSLADIQKIRKELNWNPKIRIESGVKNLLNQINYWNKAPVWTPKKIKKATKKWFEYLKK